MYNLQILKMHLFHEVRERIIKSGRGQVQSGRGQVQSGRGQLQSGRGQVWSGRGRVQRL